LTGKTEVIGENVFYFLFVDKSHVEWNGTKWEASDQPSDP
jgi:hypothetical protein